MLHYVILTYYYHTDTLLSYYYHTNLWGCWTG
jgi:hypothetical protein